MSFSFDTATNIGKVRALCRDTDASSYVLSDEEINVFLSLEENCLYSSAALALESIAADKAKLSKSISAGDYKEDTTKIADQLLKTAEKFRERANSIPAEAQVEEILTDFNYNDILTNKALRGEYDY